MSLPEMANLFTSLRFAVAQGIVRHNPRHILPFCESKKNDSFVLVSFVSGCESEQFGCHQQLLL